MKYLLIVISLYTASAIAYDYSDSTIKKENAYGYGVHMDQYGRAVAIKPDNSNFNPSLKIQENIYGHRKHSDQYGRPVTIQPYGFNK